MASSEADLMFGMLVAERLASAYVPKATEFSSIGSLMQGDLAGADLQLRHGSTMPKSMLSFFAVIDRAGFNNKD